MPPEGLVTEGSLPFGIFHCFDRAVLDRLSLIAGEDLVAAELLAAVYGDFELAQDPKAADGSSLMDAFLHFDRRRGEEAFKFLTGVFARNAPREIFMMFDGKVENPDREAMILRNISDATRDYWWNLRQRRILSTYFDMDRYTVRMDTSATTLARCVRRVLSGKISPAVNRLVTLTFATHSSPGVSEVAWKWLKRMPPDAKNIEMVDAYPEGLGKKAALRIISWLDPVADIEVSARSVLRSALNSPVEEVRNSAAKILVRNFGPDDATTTLISMAFGENEVGKAIRDSLPPGLVDDRLQSDVLPSLLNGTLSTVAKSYLPAWVGRDGRVTSAFMAMVADTERRWDNRGAAELANIMFMMRDSRASIPNAMWALFSSCIGRSTGSYHLAMASCALALAHPMVVPGHDMVLRLLHDEAYWVDTCPTSARLAAVNVAFRTRLIRLLNSDALPPIVHGTLVKELALVGDDDELQGFAAETLEQAIRDPRVETEHILSSLGSVNWGNRLITAVEALAEGSSDIQLELVRLLATRIPGTARVLPQGNQERTAALEDVYSQMSSLFAFPLSEIPTERSGYEGLIEEFEWRENGPQLCLERTGVAGRSPALVWLQNYEFDPHHAFWNYMPDALVRILIETRTDDGGVPVRGSETLTLEFKDKIMLRSELNEFLSAKFSGEDLPTSPWKTSRTDRFGSDYAQRRAKEVALAVIRSNLGLLCRRSSEPSSATTFEIERPRKLGSSVVEPSTLGRELLHFHPHLFFKAYRETAFSDAYDLNARKVLKKGPAERVIPALGLNANEKARLQHDLVFLEKIACQWLLSGAQVVDMTGWSGVNDGRIDHLRENRG
jgi:hypothetical protein